MIDSKWFVRPVKKSDCEMRIFCFPYAGGSATTFLPWVKSLPSWIELVAVQPPGRSSRLFDPPYTQMDSLIDDLISSFANLTDKPYVFYGHSLGSRIAFELSKRCQSMGLALPIHFIASGSRAPFIPCREEHIFDLPEEEFIEELKQLNGTPEEVLDNQELMSLLLPALRADFQIADTYCSDGTQVDCPVTVLSGSADTDIKHTDLESWGKVFKKLESLEILQGGHFFIESNVEAVLKIVNRVIRKEFESLGQTMKNVQLELASIY